MNHHSNIKIRAQSAPWDGGIEIAVMSRSESETGPTRLHYASNLTFQEITLGERLEPLLRLSRDQGQTLMDDLWNAGIRPTEGTGSAGSLAATQKHLDDYRKLVDRILPVALTKGTG